MRSWLVLLAALPALGGCQTQHSLRDNTVKTTATLTDLNYRQVLDNVAMFVAHPGSMPSVAIVNSGTVTVSDQKTLNASATYNPTLTFHQQGGGALPILSLLLNPSCSRSLTENWSLVPVTDVDNLRRIRCAFQILVLNGGQSSDCYDCQGLLDRFYLGESDRIDCWIPQGWYRTGCEKDVPKDACYVGHYCDTYVWVLGDSVEGLARFTMTIIDLATGKPHAPMQTVVRTYKSDGSLDNTQVTTTELDRKALEKMRTDPRDLERSRPLQSTPLVNPGYFFVPR
jgi:hypothetical protein